MSYPTEWWIQGKIDSATRDLAKSHQVHSLESDLSSLRHRLADSAERVGDLERQVYELQATIQEILRRLDQSLAE